MDASVPTLSFVSLTRGASYCGTLPTPSGALALTFPSFCHAGAGDARATFDFAGFCWDARLRPSPDAPRYLSASLLCVGPSQDVHDNGFAPAGGGSWRTPPVAFEIRCLAAGAEGAGGRAAVGAATVAVAAPAAGIGVTVPVTAFTHGVGGAVFEAPRFARLADVRRECAREDGSVRVEMACHVAADGACGTSGREEGGRRRPLLLRMLDDPAGSLADVELRGADFGDGGGGVRAHRAVLAAGSQYFASMFRRGDFREGTGVDGVVCFDDIGCRGLSVVVRYMYGDRAVVQVGSEVAQDLGLFLEVWLFSSVRLLEELESELAGLSLLAAQQPGTAARPPDGGPWNPALVRVFAQAVLLNSRAALPRLARLFEELLPLPHASALHAAVLRFSADEICALLSELPPAARWLALARAWLDAGDAAADRGPRFGARVVAAFGVDDMDAAALADVDAYAFAAPYLERAAFLRIARKLAGARAGGAAQGIAAAQSHLDVQIREGGGGGLGGR
jgi:BTB/POZ domain